MDDLANYMLAQERRYTAFERYNYAGAALENAWIRERLNELKSQVEPMEGLLKSRMIEQDRIYAAAHYVVFGRFPPIDKEATEQSESDGNEQPEPEHDPGEPDEETITASVLKVACDKGRKYSGDDALSALSYASGWLQSRRPAIGKILLDFVQTYTYKPEPEPDPGFHL